MNRIVYPLKPRMQGPEVADLQGALRMMLEREAIYPNDPRARAASMTSLPSEQQVQTYGSTTAKTVMAFQQGRQLQADGIVGRQTANAINSLLEEWGALTQPPESGTSYQVQGQIQQSNAFLSGGGIPLAGALVRVFDKDLRHEQFLGEAFSDRQGHYFVAFTVAQFRRAEYQSADLLLRVLGPDGAVLASPPVIFNAGQSELVDLIVPGPPQYEQLTAVLGPLLEGLSYAELAEDDISFLSNETGIERSSISILVSATKLASLSGLSEAVHYGMLREGLPARLSSLQEKGRDAQRRALVDAMKNKIISDLSSEDVDAILDRLDAL